MQAVTLPGDFNVNGVVDAADYTLWRDNVGTTNVLPNDPTGGTIGATQYNTWRNNFGQGSSAGGASVPEPSSAVLAAACFLLALGTSCCRRAGV